MASTRSWTVSCLFAVASLAALGCDQSSADTDPESEVGTLSGTVRDAVSQAFIEGVIVTISGHGKSDTTDAAGKFSIADVPVGAGKSLSATVTGYERYSSQLTVLAGVSTQNISMDRKVLLEFGDFTAYMSPTVLTFEAVLFVLPGAGGDARPIIREEIPDPVAVDLFDRLKLLADARNVAIVGTADLPSDPNLLTGGLRTLATESGRPELTDAPIVLFGFSAGGCLSYSFARTESEVLIGFVTMKGGCHGPQSGAEAVNVPGYLFIGESDTDSRAQNISGVFTENRAVGAPWAIATELGGDHTPVADNTLVLEWITAILDLRLPASGSVLNPVDVSAGWLGNTDTHVVGKFACLKSDKALAAWFPTEAVARSWQAFSSGGTATATDSC